MLMRLVNLIECCLAGLAVALAISGCAGVKVRATKINPGESRAEVLKLMGRPDDRQFQGKLEVLQYGMVVTIGVCDYTMVWLRDGAVTGVSSYRHFSTMGCRSGLQPVDWGGAP
jgi:hypothetical protein